MLTDIRCAEWILIIIGALSIIVMAVIAWLVRRQQGVSTRRENERSARRFIVDNQGERSYLSQCAMVASIRQVHPFWAISRDVYKNFCFCTIDEQITILRMEYGKKFKIPEFKKWIDKSNSAFQKDILKYALIDKQDIFPLIKLLNPGDMSLWDTSHNRYLNMDDFKITLPNKKEVTYEDYIQEYSHVRLTGATCKYSTEEKQYFTIPPISLILGLSYKASGIAQNVFNESIRTMLMVVLNCQEMFHLDWISKDNNYVLLDKDTRKLMERYPSGKVETLEDLYYKAMWLLFVRYNSHKIHGIPVLFRRSID
ncbi:MAG: hypothetical protein FWH57_12295 [Oscillospiraceae bacterium]|nr:hypothetical protein [Oscillospiraceae bacterium]